VESALQDFCIFSVTARIAQSQKRKRRRKFGIWLAPNEFGWDAVTATGQKYVYDFQQDPFLKIARRKDERIEAEHFCGADEFRRCQELWARKALSWSN